MSKRKLSFKYKSTTENTDTELEVEFTSEKQIDQSSRGVIGLISDYLPTVLQCIIPLVIEVFDKLV